MGVYGRRFGDGMFANTKLIFRLLPTSGEMSKHVLVSDNNTIHLLYLTQLLTQVNAFALPGGKVSSICSMY